MSGSRIAEAMHDSGTAPLVLSKYERVQILASRVEQLLAGAPKLVDIDTDDVQRIAEEEIARRALPLVVARSLPNNKKRLYDLRDFIDPASHTMMPALEDAPPDKTDKTSNTDKIAEDEKLTDDPGQDQNQNQNQNQNQGKGLKRDANE